MHAVIVGRKRRGVQINLRQRGFMYFRRTMVMSEEEEEEEEPLPRRRDAAISTNCDMYMFPPSLPLYSHLQQASSHVAAGCENLDFHFRFQE